MEDITEYQILLLPFRADSSRRKRPPSPYKGRWGFHSGRLQPPSDPDATFREKAWKEYQRYVSNREESIGKNGTVVTEYQYEQNTDSDSQFLKDSLDKTPGQTEWQILITDGAYGWKENRSQAADKISALSRQGFLGCR